MNLDVLLQGLIAGYGIAIPVGPIGILIVELGIRRGFSIAFCAGLGAASADLIYSSVAALAGAFLIQVLTPFALFIHYLGAIVLITIGIWLLYQGRRLKQTEQRTPRGTSTGCIGTYGLFLGLTLLNPLTVTYFTSLILGLRVTITTSALDVAVFVVATFLASLSWQTLLACLSGLSHKRLSPRFQEATFALGNCVVIALGLLILLGLNI